MKKFRTLPLLSIIVTSSLLMTGITPKALAEAGSAKVYIICLSGVPGWSFPNQTVDIQKVKDGAIHALSPKESTGIPLVHPKYGNTPPFYSVTYYVVTDWVLYKNIIESYKGVIVINTHGEILPVPSGYSTPADWVDKIADAFLDVVADVTDKDWVELQNLTISAFCDSGRANEPYVNAVSVDQPKQCLLRIAAFWVFFDENDVNHWMTTNLEVTYFNGTAYRKATIPICLGVLID